MEYGANRHHFNDVLNVDSHRFLKLPLVPEHDGHGFHQDRVLRLEFQFFDHDLRDRRKVVECWIPHLESDQEALVVGAEELQQGQFVDHGVKSDGVDTTFASRQEWGNASKLIQTGKLEDLILGRKDESERDHSTH